jgi:hypothetical protein
MKKRKRIILTLLAAMMLFVATTAESCQTAANNLKNSADATTATCNDLQNSSQLTSEFLSAQADQANSTKSPDQIKSAAQASLDKHCSSNANPNYKPYSDVAFDLITS